MYPADRRQTIGDPERAAGELATDLDHRAGRWANSSCSSTRRSSGTWRGGCRRSTRSGAGDPSTPELDDRLVHVQFDRLGKRLGRRRQEQGRIRGARPRVGGGSAHPASGRTRRRREAGRGPGGRRRDLIAEGLALRVASGPHRMESLRSASICPRKPTISSSSSAWRPGPGRDRS